MDMLHKLPQELCGVNINSKSTHEVLGFFGSLNPLSNFYPCSFTYKGKDYHSSEQYIQHMKAEFFGDDSIVNHILNSCTALECKQLSKDIRNYDPETWLPAAKSVCEHGMAAKF